MSNLSKLTNLAEVARRMGKTRHWLYQRLNGNIVNGKPAEFKPAERSEFLEVLAEMWQELGSELESFKRGDD